MIDQIYCSERKKKLKDRIDFNYYSFVTFGNLLCPNQYDCCGSVEMLNILKNYYEALFPTSMDFYLLLRKKQQNK